MKILIVSTLKRKVDSVTTASRSQIIYHLSRGLALKGHTVDLLGTGDSVISGVRTIPFIERGWVDLPPVENPFFRETASLIDLAYKAAELSPNYDIIHNHCYPDFVVPSYEDRFVKPLVTTIHIQATDYIDSVFSHFKKTHLVSISNAHKALFKKTQINSVVYNGIDTDLFRPTQAKGDYLLWLGRLGKAKDDKGNFVDSKGVRWAIKLAQETGWRLKLSAAVENAEFFERDVKPHLCDKIEWVGSVSAENPLSRSDVVDLMSGARAYLMTVNWYEPFGLVMAEAMACGTPIIGFDRGSVSELVVEGKTGFVVKPDLGTDGLKQALLKIDSIDSLVCRKHVEDNFSISHMVDNYESLYKSINNV